LMHFAEELVKPDSLQIPGHLDIGSKELEMAGELVDRMTGEWDASKYTDDYRHALLDLIEKKIELGDKALPADRPSKKAATNVVDLASVLQESLQHATRGGAAKKRTPKQKRHLKKAA
jgi:DNA end-binding protein Ku